MQQGEDATYGRQDRAYGGDGTLSCVCLLCNAQCQNRRKYEVASVSSPRSSATQLHTNATMAPTVAAPTAVAGDPLHPPHALIRTLVLIA